MRVIGLDFETYYDKEYSLSKLTTEEYVRDSRFEAMIVGIKEDDAPAYTKIGKDIGPALDKLKLHECAVIAHHAHFDGLILSHHYGIRPKVWIDTLSLARPHVPGSLSLGGLAKHFNLPAKGDEVVNAVGVRLAAMSSLQLNRYRKYCEHDVELTCALANLLLDQTPKDELKIADMVIRMFTEPVLRLDYDILRELHEDITVSKMTVMMLAGVAQDELLSNNKFAEVLRALGVEPPMKLSLTTGRQTFAFAKTDGAMRALAEHPDPRVQAVVAARLGVKSTLAETRAARMMAMSQRGTAPVYLLYAGARQTGRLSGGDKMNWQNNARNRALTTNNLPIGKLIITPSGAATLKSGGEGAVCTSHGDFATKDCHELGLRDAIQAPDGYVLVVVDSANIEARGLAWVAKQKDALDRFRAGVDPYCHMASRIFSREVTKADGDARRLGKIAVLGLGYGMGPSKFLETCAQNGITISSGIAEMVVAAYRHTYHRVEALWKAMERAIPDMAAGRERWVVPGVVRTCDSGLVLPSGRIIRYPMLLYSGVSGGWEYAQLGGAGIPTSKLYGGKCVENIVQALARDIVLTQTLNISRAGYRVVLSAHDEAVMCVPEDQAEECLAFALTAMRTPPAWAADLPLDAEGGYHKSYGGAK